MIEEHGLWSFSTFSLASDRQYDNTDMPYMSSKLSNSEDPSEEEAQFLLALKILESVRPDGDKMIQLLSPVTETGYGRIRDVAERTRSWQALFNA